MYSDLDSTFAWTARSKGSSTLIAEIGFCRGGRSTWLDAAHNPKLQAAVAFYGPVKGPISAIQPQTAFDITDNIKCPVLGLNGGKDTSIQMSDVEAMVDKARAAHKIAELHIYPNSAHGFHADHRPSYNEADAKDGWDRMLAWFKKYGVAPKTGAA